MAARTASRTAAWVRLWSSLSVSAKCAFGGLTACPSLSCESRDIACHMRGRAGSFQAAQNISTAWTRFKTGRNKVNPNGRGGGSKSTKHAR
eukprot:10871208-Alexandrium_andersonii.AAC.1